MSCRKTCAPQLEERLKRLLLKPDCCLLQMNVLFIYKAGKSDHVSSIEMRYCAQSAAGSNTVLLLVKL